MAAIMDAMQDRLITPEIAKLAFLKAFNKVQSSLESAKKDATNPHFKSRYASLASVNETIMDKIGAAGFCLLSGCQTHEDRPQLVTTLYHVDGHSESFSYPLIKTDNPQHLASAITYARRYSICALFNLSVEDDDGNAAVPKNGNGHKNGTNGAANGHHEEAPKEEPKKTTHAVTDDGGEFTTHTVDFIPSEFKENKTKNGVAQFWIKSPSGDAYSTMNKTHGAMMNKAHADAMPLRVIYVEKGKYKNIFSLQDHTGAVV